MPTVITPKSLNDETPSRKIQKFAAQFNIGYPTELRLLRHQGADKFFVRVSLSNRHTFSTYHLKYFTAFEHPFTEKLLHFYRQQKESRPLWCYVHASSADSSRPVVRTTSERMVKAALFRALNAAGYDASGRSLDGSEKALQGTIRIAISEPKKVLQIEFGQLQDYLSQLLSNIVKRLHTFSKPSR
ncbi:8a1af383-9481-4b6d-afc4-b9b49bf1b45e [Thermothielavioides terrestris]|nr:8a1af383-9481-4b6d-afc4-b9b49bf1b45e [Thermothielavioides terrestris]